MDGGRGALGPTVGRSSLPEPSGERHPLIELMLRRMAHGSRRGARTDGATIALAIEGGGSRGVVSGGMCLALEKAGLIDAVDDLRHLLGGPERLLHRGGAGRVRGDQLHRHRDAALCQPAASADRARRDRLRRAVRRADPRPQALRRGGSAHRPRVPGAGRRPRELRRHRAGRLPRHRGAARGRAGELLDPAAHRSPGHLPRQADGRRGADRVDPVRARPLRRDGRAGPALQAGRPSAATDTRER